MIFGGSETPSQSCPLYSTAIKNPECFHLRSTSLVPIGWELMLDVPDVQFGAWADRYKRAMLVDTLDLEQGGVAQRQGGVLRTMAQWLISHTNRTKNVPEQIMKFHGLHTSEHFRNPRDRPVD